MTSKPAGGDAPDVRVTTTIETDRTVVVVEGTHDAAVVVNSASGERVYLPPETATGEADVGSKAHDDSPYAGIPTESPYEGITTDNPYEGIATESPYAGMATDSPYEGISTDSPYEGMATDSPYDGLSDDDNGTTRRSEAYGIVPTDDGFRLVHPEPATDVRFLR
ncbi:hypothetical protein HLRTI_001069 [Halorhabdus tiamatea SARL4B]|uniref:Uncharacterized protein n=1 Tax=Halorhabdus tiamatea SARL4B TaxID=1033806 RepID=F7PJ78_9EURY|nr:hypothetical protein [Halorhabdus tiamatea]ERJ06815.1 hypothetical protein HLRTI_001069 [Halorhabdus tiamatea SARL4B]CCQ33046.1 hypothetical protein HTIA_0907 [Halorhabdus tiamatea SARL4B]